MNNYTDDNILYWKLEKCGDFCSQSPKTRDFALKKCRSLAYKAKFNIKNKI